MDIKYKNSDKSIIVYVSGELDEYSSSTAKTLLDNLFDGIGNSKNVVFDLSNLTFMDSTGIGLLIGRYKKLSKIRVPTFIRGANPSIEKVLDLSGLYQIMPKI